MLLVGRLVASLFYACDWVFVSASGSRRFAQMHAVKVNSAHWFHAVASMIAAGCLFQPTAASGLLLHAVKLNGARWFHTVVSMLAA